MDFRTGRELFFLVLVAGNSRHLSELGIVGTLNFSTHPADLRVLGSDPCRETRLGVNQVDDGSLLLLRVLLALIRLGFLLLLVLDPFGCIAELHLPVHPHEHFLFLSQPGDFGLFCGGLYQLELALVYVGVVLVHGDAGFAGFLRVPLPRVFGDLDAEVGGAGFVPLQLLQAVQFGRD